MRCPGIISEMTVLNPVYKVYNSNLVAWNPPGNQGVNGLTLTLAASKIQGTETSSASTCPTKRCLSCERIKDGFGPELEWRISPIGEP